MINRVIPFNLPKREAFPSSLVSVPRKTHFVNELMEVWRTLSTCSEVAKIWAIGIHKNFQTCSIKDFFWFLKHCYQLILLTHESTLELQNLQLLKCLLKLSFSGLLCVDAFCKTEKCSLTVVSYITLTHM